LLLVRRPISCFSDSEPIPALAASTSGGLRSRTVRQIEFSRIGGHPTVARAAPCGLAGHSAGVHARLLSSGSLPIQTLFGRLLENLHQATPYTFCHRNPWPTNSIPPSPSCLSVPLGPIAEQADVGCSIIKHEEQRGGLLRHRWIPTVSLAFISKHARESLYRCIELGQPCPLRRQPDQRRKF